MMAARRKRKYRRRKARIEPEPALLVVTEGKKTEPKYLKAVRKLLHLVATRIEILKADGTDPQSIVEYAISKRAQRQRKAKRGEGIEYEAVWAVFDSEQKLGSEELKKVLQLANNENILVAMSSPCFEYWFVLHFEYTTAYMCTYSEVESKLKNHLAAYDKGDPPIEALLPRIIDAVENASRCRREQDKANAELPRTDVDLLVTTMNRAAREHYRFMEYEEDTSRS